MGCDIHAMMEIKKAWFEGCQPRWHNAGDPLIGRNYEIFAVLGNVRNDEEIPFIGELRFNTEGINDWAWDLTSEEFKLLVEAWGADGHSHSYVTLAEMKAYDKDQKIYSHRFVSERDENGKIISTCGGSSRKDLEEVGETNIFGPWGTEPWDKLVTLVERTKWCYGITSDDDVRIVFFFDN